MLLKLIGKSSLTFTLNGKKHSMLKNQTIEVSEEESSQLPLALFSFAISPMPANPTGNTTNTNSGATPGSKLNQTDGVPVLVPQQEHEARLNEPQAINSKKSNKRSKFKLHLDNKNETPTL